MFGKRDRSHLKGCWWIRVWYKEAKWRRERRDRGSRDVKTKALLFIKLRVMAAQEKNPLERLMFAAFGSSISVIQKEDVNGWTRQAAAFAHLLMMHQGNERTMTS